MHDFRRYDRFVFNQAFIAIDEHESLEYSYGNAVTKKR